MKINFYYVKIKVILTLFLFIFCNYFVFSQQSFIDDIINKVNIDTLSKFVKELSGEIETNINGEKVYINSRFHSSYGNILAEKYIESKLKSYKLDTYLQKFDNTITNVIAIKKGLKYPNWKYIICAHYDSNSENPSIAPGADDNASGVSVVLEAARILSNYNSNYTIVFALWDEEEIGLKGSYYYALECRNNNDTIMGVLNLDMIGYDGLKDNNVTLNTQQNSLSFLITNKINLLNSQYNFGLKIKLDYLTQLSSDHISFISFGYPAVLMIESDKSGDFNPFYHSSNDRINNFNLQYFEKCAKVSIGTIASLSESNNISSCKKENLDYNSQVELSFYPNPFNSEITFKINLPKNTNIKIEIWDELGKEVDLIYDGLLNYGTHFFKWKSKNKSSSVYFVTLKTPNEMITKKINFIK